jgi:hypothetical protein
MLSGECVDCVDCGNFFWFLVVHVRNGCGALLPRVVSGVLLVARLGWFVLWILNFEGKLSWLVWCQGYVADVMLKQMGLFFFPSKQRERSGTQWRLRSCSVSGSGTLGRLVDKNGGCFERWKTCEGSVLLGDIWNVRWIW